MRAELRAGSAADFVKRIEGWISKTVPGASITKVEPADSPSGESFVLQAELRGPNYAQLMNNRLLVFKPVIVNRRSAFSFSESTRKYPLVIPSQQVTDVVRVQLPQEFKVDEVPESVKLDTNFGKYHSTYEIAEGFLVVTRVLSTFPALVPASSYADVRSFFLRISTAEQALVVLLKN